MGDFLVRDLDEWTHSILKKRAEASGRSLQAEVKMILECAAKASDDDAARVQADRIRASLSGRAHPDSSGCVRAVRDR